MLLKRATESIDDDSRIAAVTRRLHAQVTGISVEIVEHHVRASFDQWSDAPVRDFVPILAERAAKTALDKLHT